MAFYIVLWMFRAAATAMMGVVIRNTVLRTGTPILRRARPLPGKRIATLARRAKKDGAMNVMNSEGWSHWPARIVGSALAIALVVSALASGVDSVSARKRANAKLAQTFDVSGPIAIPDGGQSLPSTIAVSGFETEVADVNVTLFGITHGAVNDLDFLLVSPGGQSAVIVSDVGSNANNATLALDDQEVSQISSAGALTTGTFQPTNFQSGDSFSPPAPQPTPSNSKLGVFNSTDPNGTWSLHIRDDNFGTTGSLTGGWSLIITSANGVPNASPDTYQAQAGKTLTGDPSVLANDEDPDIDPLTAILAGKPKKGTLQLAPDGAFTYRPKKKAKGTDSFTYLAQDPGGLSDLETATIKIKKAKKKKGKK
jgi:subtilisin-like proprotein convertase family protein